MSVGRLVLRLVVGGAFVGHGTQKLFGWFGGGGLEGTAGTFERIGLRPGRANAVAAGVAETAGGAMVAAGLAMPVAAAVLTGTMLTAIKRVHLANGPWIANRGYEYNAVLIAGVLALTEAGAGRPSLDQALGGGRSGRAWALGALGAGLAGAYAVDALARRTQPAAEPALADTASPVAA